MKVRGSRIRSLAGLILVILMILSTVCAEDAQSLPASAGKKGKGLKIKDHVLVSCTSEESTVTVPDGVRTIGEGAFEDLKTLKKVILPDSVRKIEKRAFAGCKNLRRVVLTEESKLKKIGKQAFLNCRKLDTSFVPEGCTVASDAFEGIPDPDPTDDPGPTPTPKPTEEPTEEPAPYYPGGGVRKPPHAANTVPEGPDYDLVALDSVLELPGSGDEAANTGPMEQLTLGSETLELTLKREDRRGFTVSGIYWPESGDADPAGGINTLVLAAPEGNGIKSLWTVNGAVLRRMRKSGIARLVLQVGNRIAVLSTEEPIAGWAYEALRSRGAGSRWFNFEIEMDGEAPAVWRLRADGMLWDLTPDIHAGIYLNEAFSGTAEALKQPCDIASAAGLTQTRAERNPE